MHVKVLHPRTTLSPAARGGILMNAHGVRKGTFEQAIVPENQILDGGQVGPVPSRQSSKNVR